MKDNEDVGQARSALAQSEERFRLLVESVEDYAIFMLDRNGIVQTWNRGAERLKGYSAGEIIGKHFSTFYTDVDLARKHPEFELDHALKSGRFEEEGWRVRKDGTRFWANVVITRLLDANQNHVGFAKITRDLTAKKIAEENLRSSEQRYRLLVSAVKDYAIFLLDPTGHVATWNEGAERFKGYRPDEIIGRHFSTFYPEEDLRAKKPEWELSEATLTGRFEDEGWRIRKDGTRFWANVVITALQNPQGELIGFSKVTRDMTERRRLEEKLRRSNEELDRKVAERTAQLETAVKARDEFMSIVGHELRTPVTSMRIDIQLADRILQKNNRELFFEKSIKFIKTAGRQLDRLSKLIDDMLDMSRISIDRLAVDLQPLELTEVVRQTVDRFEEQLRASAVVLTLENETQLPIVGDSFRLEQVFSNLFTNAIKYGNGQPITIAFERFGNEARVVVKDRGSGIEAANFERVFAPFERAVSSNKVSGLGLGLYIARKIVNLHGGDITIDSQVGHGSAFTVKLPLRS